MKDDTIPHDHRAREEASDPRFNVTLEASAGTGKTRVLVDRYVRLIEAGAAPRNILAITFTRKAAAEMKHRIIQELRGQTLLWRKVRERLFDVRIATMDAFCLGLLKEFPLEANLEPDMDLLSETDIHCLLEASVEHALIPPRAAVSPDLTFLVSSFGEARLRRGIRHFLRTRLLTQPLLEAFVRQQAPHTRGPSRTLRQTSARVRHTLRNHHWATLPISARRVMNAQRVTPFDLEQVAAYFLTQNGLPRKRLSGACRRKDFDTRAEYKQHRTQVIESAPMIAEHIGRWRRDIDLYAIQELWRLYQSAARYFISLKTDRGGLDFSDVVSHAVGLLTQRESFSQSRFRLESRYHHLLIDEFQDTNEMQWSLIRSLIDSWGEGSGLVQDAIARIQASGRGKGILQEPSIFLVGDRKQSVYGWRDARVEVMDTANRYLMRIRSTEGRQLYIRQSFRSHPSLLHFLNDVFSGIPKEQEDVQWAFRYRTHDHFPILATDGLHHPVGLAIASTRIQAAAAVGDEIVRLLQEHDYQPKDIAICFRSRTHYRVYETALAQRGVPTHVYRGLGFYDSPEVRDIQAIIRYLAHPISELRAAEVLRSRFIGFSDAGLARIANSHRRRSKERPLARLLMRSIRQDRLPHALSSADRAIIADVLPKVSGWIDLADRIPPSDLLQRIVDETEYAACFIGRHGVQGWENLKKVMELIRRAQNRGYMTFARLAEYLDAASAGEESLAALETVDAVSLMTIHASKGLEFKAVFVVNMDQALRTETSLPRIQERADGTIDVHAMENVAVEGPHRALEEEKRLLYVALTRAKDYLVLSSIEAQHKERHVTFTNLLPKSLRERLHQASTTDAPELVWKPAHSPHRLRVLRPTASPRQYRDATTPPSRTLALEPLSPPAVARVTVSRCVREQWDEGASNRTWASSKSELGSTVHRMFEYAVPIDAELARVADALLPDDSEQTPAERKRAIRKVVGFYRRLYRHPELMTLVNTGRISREVPFVLTRPTQRIRGVIDSLILLSDRAVIVDYKTGSPSETHRLQMRLYLEAARAMFPQHDVSGIIFYPKGAPHRCSL